MDDLINELYYGNICPVEQMGRPTPEEKEILKRIHENEEKLRATLDEQEKAILETIKDDCLDAASIMGERRFREAFSLGGKVDDGDFQVRTAQQLPVPVSDYIFLNR